MKTLKQLVLAAMFVVTLALVMSTPVLAQITITLTNTADPADRDSGASGQATLSDVAYSSSFTQGQAYVYMTEYDFYTGDLTVRCAGLTPKATYRIGPVWTGLVYDRKTRQWTIDTYYSSVPASASGTLDLSVMVTFIGGARTWYWFSPGGSDWNGYWTYGGSWHDESYGFSVARKAGKQYVEVLQGLFPAP